MQPRISLDDQPGASHFFIDSPPTETSLFDLFFPPGGDVLRTVVLAIIFIPIFYYDFYRLRRNLVSHTLKMLVRAFIGSFGATYALKHGGDRTFSWQGILFLLFATASISVAVSFALALVAQIADDLFSPLLRYVASFFSGTTQIYQLKYEYIKEKIMGNVNNIVAKQSIVNIDSKLKNVVQNISSAPALQPDVKSQLLTLFENLKSELDKVKDSHAVQVENVSDEAKYLAEKLHGANPTKEIVKSRAENLVTAAKALEQVLPAALSIAQKIHDFIAMTFV